MFVRKLLFATRLQSLDFSKSKSSSGWNLYRMLRLKTFKIVALLKIELDKGQIGLFLKVLPTSFASI